MRFILITQELMNNQPLSHVVPASRIVLRTALVRRDESAKMAWCDNSSLNVQIEWQDSESFG